MSPRTDQVYLNASSECARDALLRAVGPQVTADHPVATATWVSDAVALYETDAPQQVLDEVAGRVAREIEEKPEAEVETAVEAGPEKETLIGGTGGDDLD